ncbi:MAG: MvaI/BcnI family restriction endonuclease [Chloroflexi bacterium]|nr:MvaI/BcnI family restriction endonuclease [Chloroflexota bacterium]
MKLYTKEQLVEAMRGIFQQGWHKSVKTTLDTRNDGAVGNTLETLLGLKENNLPIPNAQEWELKGQRSHTGSLVTLKHIEPSPTAARIVPNLLLPHYGWRHKLAGERYPENEMSFRSTTCATEYTIRGFKIVVDRDQQKVRFVFDPTKANTSNPEIAVWLNSVKTRIGLGPITPEPYWGLDDLRYAIGSKISNCFYVIADSKVEGKHEFFLYKELYILSGFSFEKFIKCIEDGAVLIDFDARTGHNHGTKFRLRQGHWKELYSNVKRAI